MPTRDRRLLTAGLVLIVTMVAFEALAVATILPLVEADLGDLHLYGWVFSAFFLGNLVGIVLAGRAADRTRLVVPFAAGVVLFAAGLVVGASAPTMLVLVLGRGLQGLGAGALPAVAYVCIGRSYPPERRPQMFALLSTAWVVPSVIGPAIAGFVGETLGWRWVFAGLLPLVAVIGAVVVGAVWHLDAPDVGGPVPVSVRDALVVAVSGAAVLAAFGADEWWSAGVLLVTGLAAGLPAFARLTPAGTLRLARGLPAAVGLRGVLSFSFFAADAYVPYTLTTVRGYPPTTAGLALTAGALAWAAGSWAQARWVHRRGPRALVRFGYALLAVVTTGFTVVASSAVPVTVALVVWGLAGLAMGLAYPSLSVAVLGFAPPGREGSATAGLQLSETLGVALGTGTAGALVGFAAGAGWDPSTGPSLVFAMAGAVACAGLLLSMRLPDQLPREGDHTRGLRA